MALVDEEIKRLQMAWHGQAEPEAADVDKLLGAEGAGQIDLFDRLQLQQVLRVCRDSESLSDAGRALFNCSRLSKATSNDADRLRKFLARFGLSWQQVKIAIDDIRQRSH